MSGGCACATGAASANATTKAGNSFIDPPPPSCLVRRARSLRRAFPRGQRPLLLGAVQRAPVFILPHDALEGAHLPPPPAPPGPPNSPFAPTHFLHPPPH